MHPEVKLNDGEEATGNDNPTCWLKTRRDRDTLEDDEHIKINIPNRQNSSDWRFIFGNINSLIVLLTFSKTQSFFVSNSFC